MILFFPKESRFLFSKNVQTTKGADSGDAFLLYKYE